MSKALKFIEVGKQLKSIDQVMTLLCEVEDPFLDEMLETLETMVEKKGMKDYDGIYGWVRFVSDMRAVGHLIQLAWDKQRPQGFYTVFPPPGMNVPTAGGQPQGKPA